MNIINKILKIMDDKNISQKSLCTYLGISTSTFSNWKTRNTDPPVRYLKPICNYIGISYSELIESDSEDFEIPEVEPNSQNESRINSDNYLDAIRMLHDKYKTIETEACLLLCELPSDEKIKIILEIMKQSKVQENNNAQ